MNTAVFPNFLPASAEIFLTCSGIMLLLIGLFRKRGVAGWISWGVIIVFFVTTLFVLSYSSEVDEKAFFGLFVATPYTQFAKVLVLISSFLTIVLSNDYMRREEIERFEFPILVLFATVGMMIIISAGDLIALFIGMELQSVAFYVLVTFRTNSLKSIESGFRYFLFGIFSSVVFLYGCSLIYGFSGTTELTKISLSIQSKDQGASIGFIIGLAFFILGLTLKASVIPFQLWIHDCYARAPSPVTAFLLIAPPIALLCLLVQFLFTSLLFISEFWQPLISTVSCLSMLISSVMMFFEDNIKRWITYGSIGHIGFASMGLAAGSENGCSSILVYLSIYLVMHFGWVAVIISLRQKKQAVEKFKDLAGLSATHSLVAFFCFVIMLSMAGIPPFAGFFGKWLVLTAIMDSQLYLLALIGGAASFAFAISYLRVVKIIYFDDLIEPFDTNTSGELNIVMFGSVVLLILFFIFPNPLISSAKIVASIL
jgi:NADH-quinone oxidoreductase subunit N